MKTHNVKCDEWLWDAIGSKVIDFAVLRDDDVFQKGDRLHFMHYSSRYDTYVPPEYQTYHEEDDPNYDYAAVKRSLASMYRSELIEIGQLTEDPEEADYIEAKIVFVLSPGAGFVKGIESGYAVVAFVVD